MEHRFLLPGDHVTARKPMRLGTLLGSCVAVCLSNPYRQVAAMNHYMLPQANGNPDHGRFGDTSTTLIIRTLFALDSDPKHYRAKLFGGAAVLGDVGPLSHIGLRNIEIARDVLHSFQIAISSEDVGGAKGRRIDFYTDRNEVSCRQIGAERDSSPKAAERRDIRVLVVDDSATARRALRLGIDGVDGMRVVGEADNPFQARERLLQTNADVITLDIEMPQMDGLTFLQHLMKRFPKPVIVVSSIAKCGSPTYRRAMAAGATAVLDKEILNMSRGKAAIEEVVAPLIRQAARSSPQGSNREFAERFGGSSQAR